MFLDLLLLRVQPPATRVAVPPFRADDHIRVAPPSKPVTQELLGPAIRAGRIDVGDPGRAGGVQYREGPGPQAGDAAIGQVILPAAGDVGRPAQSGQSQPDPGDHRPPGPERNRWHRTAVIASHSRHRTVGRRPALGSHHGRLMLVYALLALAILL